MNHSIPDGWYDNKATMRREYYYGGKLVQSYSISLISSKTPAWYSGQGGHAPWKTYPDLPDNEKMK